MVTTQPDPPQTESGATPGGSPAGGPQAQVRRPQPSENVGWFLLLEPEVRRIAAEYGLEWPAVERILAGEGVRRLPDRGEA